MTIFVDIDLVCAVYREIRLKLAMVNGNKSLAARLLGFHLRSIYKILDEDLGNAVAIVNYDYREALLVGLTAHEPVTFLNIREHLQKKQIVLSDERLRGLLEQCEIEGLIKKKGKNHKKATYAPTGMAIVGDYSEARLKASLILGADDFEEISIALKLGPEGLKAMHAWLDSTDIEKYPVHDTMVELDRKSEGKKNLIRVGVASLLHCRTKPCPLASHRRARLIMAVNEYEETPSTFIRPTRGDFTRLYADKLWSRINKLKPHFEKLAAEAEAMDQEGHEDYTISIIRGTLAE